MTAQAPTYDLTFDAETHTYTLNGRVVPSVTAVIDRLKPVFDAPHHAARVAQREGVTTEQMLARWSAKCDTAADKGTLVHDAIKQYASTGESRVDIPEFQAWRRWWLTTGMVPIALEHMVASVDIGVAGTLDALLYSRKTDKLHVFDWKTNERFRLSSQYREFMLPPFSDVPCCEFQSYSLQVSLYRLMLERSGRHRTLFGPSYDRACGASWIVHIGAERATPYRAVDYRARLLEWLEQEPFWSNLSTNA